MKIGSFLNWGYPKIDGFCEGKSYSLTHTSHVSSRPASSTHCMRLVGANNTSIKLGKARQKHAHIFRKNSWRECPFRGPTVGLVFAFFSLLFIFSSFFQLFSSFFQFFFFSVFFLALSVVVSSFLQFLSVVLIDFSCFPVFCLEFLVFLRNSLFLLQVLNSFCVECQW